MGKKKGQRNNRQFEVTWFDGRCRHCIQCDAKVRKRTLTTLYAQPWVSQIRTVPVVMRRKFTSRPHRQSAEKEEIMSNETYIPFSELVAQGSSRIIGAQRVDTDRAGDLTEHLERFRNSPLAQECAAQLAQRPDADRCWKVGNDYVFTSRDGWIV